MGNCISKISKDPLLAFEEFMKNKTFLEKGRIRPSHDRLTGETYTRIHSIKGFSKKETLAPLQTEMWWKNLFLQKTSVQNKLEISGGGMQNIYQPCIISYRKRRVYLWA